MNTKDEWRRAPPTGQKTNGVKMMKNNGASTYKTRQRKTQWPDDMGKPPRNDASA